MSADFPGAAAKKRPLTGMLVLSVLAFLVGLVLMAWVLSRWSWAATTLGIAPAPVPVVAAPVPEPEIEPEPPAGKPKTEVARAPRPGTPQSIVIDPEMTRRVAQLEQRLGEVTEQSRAAIGNADRAEGLLVAFAARRALDRGVALGYIEGLLRQRFGDTQPAAVATIITASRDPVTLEELQTGLQEVGPQLTGAGPDQNWWDALKAELAGMVTVRKEGTPSTMPAERLSRATRRLEAGQVDVALAEVLRMPGRGNATEWIQKARRYVAARRALDTIETAALLDPRNPPQAAALRPRSRQPG